MKYQTYAKVFIALVSIHQLIIGVLGSLSPELSQALGKLAWNATIDPTPQYFLVAVLMNTYIIGFGLFLWFLSRNPAKHTKYFWVPTTVFSLQAIQTIIHFGEFTKFFAVPNAMAWLNVLITAVVVAIFVYLKNKLEK